MAIVETTEADRVDIVAKSSKDTPKKGDLEAIIELMDQEGLDELEVWDGTSKVKLSRHSYSQAAAVPVRGSTTGIKKSEKTAPAAAVESGTPIKSPLAGVFYRSPSPQAPVFVKEGDIVSPEKTVCIVEAMKVLNQINAGVSGRIIKICVENGKPIQTGQTLFIVEAQT